MTRFAITALAIAVGAVIGFVAGATSTLWWLA